LLSGVHISKSAMYMLVTVILFKIHANADHVFGIV